MAQIDPEKIFRDDLEELGTNTTAMASEMVGKALLRHIIDELSGIPHPTIENQSVWSTMREAQQEEIGERIIRRIKFEVAAGYREILANGLPALSCELKSVKFTGKGIQGTLEISKSGHAHDLADFAGNQVVIILAQDLEQYFAGMDEIIVHHDQGELELDDTIDELLEEGKQLVTDDPEIPEYLAELDPGRIMWKDGAPVELSPDPDCDVCGGDGTLLNQASDDGLPYVACECTVLPAAPA